MFNHARTLLLNLSGASGYLPDHPGEELIPAEYRPVVLPTYLNVVRMRLFGTTPDRAMLNYRSAQLLQLVAATELQSHVLALDPRITYRDPSSLLLRSTFTPQVQKYLGPDSAQLTLVGEPASPDSSGKSIYDYRATILTVTGGTQLQIQRLTFPFQDVVHPLTLSGQLSPEFALPYSGYRIRVNTQTPSAWIIRGFLRPRWSLSEIEQSLRSIGEPYLLSLFGVTDEEPYRTFRNCWNSHPEFAYRLGGLVLALTYRTEELRRAEK